jgi:hypothetical protein
MAKKTAKGARALNGSYQTGAPRTKTMGVRLTAEEERIIIRAAPRGVAPSVWLRQLALEAAENRR